MRAFFPATAPPLITNALIIIIMTIIVIITITVATIIIMIIMTKVFNDPQAFAFCNKSNTDCSGMRAKRVLGTSRQINFQ